MGKPEGIIEDYLQKRAKELDFFCTKFTSPGQRGVPDRILVGHGHTFFVELKKPNGKTRLSQNCVINKIRKHGGSVYVIDSKQSVESLLQHLVNNGSYEPPSEKTREQKIEYVGNNKQIIRRKEK